MKKMLLALAILTSLCTNAKAQAGATAAEVTRRVLLLAPIDGQKTVDHVEVREISIAPNYKFGAHIHPCPVVGTIVSGEIVFQVEGKPEQILKPGDAFYEPADVVILKFDTRGQPAKFIANFLLGKDQQNGIKMVEKQ